MDVKLEPVEQKFHFKYPEIYWKLYRDGMLDWYRGWNEPWSKQRNWYTEVYPTLLDNPPLLLHAYDFEPLTTQRVLEEAESFSNQDDYRHAKPEFRFIPFAQNGAGDLYVFQFDRQNGEDVPVTFVECDSGKATVQAKNFQDFIFRTLLEAVEDIYEDSKIMKETNRTNILKSHKPYLTQHQGDILTKIYAREPFEYKYTTSKGKGEFSLTGLISHSELHSILQREIGFENLDYKFEYMDD